MASTASGSTSRQTRAEPAVNATQQNCTPPEVASSSRQSRTEEVPSGASASRQKTEQVASTRKQRRTERAATTSRPSQPEVAVSMRRQGQPAPVTASARPCRAEQQVTAADLPAPPSRPPPVPPPKPSRPAPPAAAASAANGRATNGHAGTTLDVELWICLDFEWTCDDGERRKVHAEEGEIIEFSFAVYDAKAGRVACEGQHYCKNIRTPITDFCVDLTGITQEKLENAGTLQDALLALESALATKGLVGRPLCAVAHGSADLELMLPSNCRALGLEVPGVLRRYVDLREATQSHLEASGVRGVRASSLRQICDALNVEMIGEEHCGLDDSWMVLLALQELLKAGANLHFIDLDAERRNFASSEPCDYGNCWEQKLCLDGLPFFAVAAEVKPWLEDHIGQTLDEGALSVVLGLDGRPTGRAVVDFGSHEAAHGSLRAFDGGKRIICGSLDSWPFEPPKERLILVRPLRRQELALLGRPVPETGSGGGPALAAFPADAQELAVLRGSGCGKGRGRGGSSRQQRPTPAEGCEGTIKMFNGGKGRGGGFGFISYPGGEVFVHCSDCHGDPPVEGAPVIFDVVEDPRTGKMKAVNAICAAPKPRP